MPPDDSASPADQLTEQAAGALPPPGERRRLDLHRRRAIITADRIDVRPSRTAIVPPLAGFLCGALCLGLIVLGVTTDALPTWLLALLLLFALLAVPLSGITLVYALVGANVIFDRAKQSGAWQQGFLGMGIGTTDLVPFWKLEAILVTQAGAPGATLSRRNEEFAQWEAIALKQSGKQLPIAGMTMPIQFARAGFADIRDLGAAIAALTGAPLRIAANAPPAAEPAADPPHSVRKPRPAARPRAVRQLDERRKPLRRR